MALLEVQNLQTHFRTPEGINRAVDGVSFHVDEGETLAIVGESGCGKSVTSMSLLRLIPEPPGKIAGSVRFGEKEILQLSDREMRAIRGNDISMIFQEPMTSLNPVLTVGRQIGETLRMHQGLDRQAAEARAIEMLTLVGIPEPTRRLRSSINCRICAWIVTSSAVVGSSAIRSLGLQASEIAIITRWRMPPES